MPRLMEEGKLHRTAGVLEKANRLCPETTKQTWAAEVEVLAELGRYAEARALVQQIGAVPDAPEAAKLAATEASANVKRFDKKWPGREKVTEEMRKPYRLAEKAEAAGKSAEAMALYQRAWEAWPLNGQALVNAGLDAKALGKKAEAQRLFDRAVAPDGAVSATLRAIVHKDASYLFTPSGYIDFQGTAACAARALAVCRIGPYSLPFEVCEERFYSPGLLVKILSGDTSYLDPEAESPPLTCAPSAP